MAETGNEPVGRGGLILSMTEDPDPGWVSPLGRPAANSVTAPSISRSQTDPSLNSDRATIYNKETNNHLHDRGCSAPLQLASANPT